MFGKLVLLAISLSIIQSVYSEADLQNQNADHLNPLHNNDNNLPEKEQAKRTIFSPSYTNFGLAKHVGVSHGKRVVLGYTPVDLKFVPVVKPLRGYHYSRPKFQLRPSFLKPKPNPWKPVQTVHKPLPVNVPPPAHRHHLVKPAVEEVHVHKVPVHVHQPLPIKPAVPFHPVVVTPTPIVPVVSPVPVHHHVLPVVSPAPVHHHHLDHFHNHIDHVHYSPSGIATAIPQPPILPAYPAVAPQALLPAFRPSPLFEVGRPDLGVLPLGATFQAPVLPEVPRPAFVHQHVVPQLHQHLVPQHVVPQHVTPVHQHVTPFVHQHVTPLPQPQLVPQPVEIHHHGTPVVPQVLPRPTLPTGTSIEFHGTYHPLAINGQVPRDILPAVPNTVQQFFAPPVNAAHPVLPTTYHNVQSHNIPQAQPQQDFNQVFHPQLPTQPQMQNFFTQPEQPQPVQPLDTNQGYTYNTPQQNYEDYDSQNIIQPGQTDLQLPLHLPQHDVFNRQQQEYQQQYHNYQAQDQLSQQSENIFRPSPALEAPYINRRTAEDRSSEVEEDYSDEEIESREDSEKKL